MIMVGERVCSPAEVLGALFKIEQEEITGHLAGVKESDIWTLINYAATKFEPPVHPPLSVLEAFANGSIENEECSFVQAHLSVCRKTTGCATFIWRFEDGAASTDKNLLEDEEVAFRQEQWRVVGFLILWVKRRNMEQKEQKLEKGMRVRVGHLELKAPVGFGESVILARKAGTSGTITMQATGTGYWYVHLDCDKVAVYYPSELVPE